MRFKFFRVAVVGVFIAVSSFANATLVNTDYAVIGDGLTVTDTNTNYEWLDLSLTTNITLEAALTTYSSYNLATRSQFEGLITAAFSEYSEFSPTAVPYQLDNITAADTAMLTEWRRLFGGTFVRYTDSLISAGFYASALQKSGLESGGVRRGPEPRDGALHVGSKVWDTDSVAALSASNTGYFLVKTADVPEPSSLAILALGMIGLASRRFNKQS